MLRGQSNNIQYLFFFEIGVERVMPGYEEGNGIHWSQIRSEYTTVTNILPHAMQKTKRIQHVNLTSQLKRCHNSTISARHDYMRRLPCRQRDL